METLKNYVNWKLAHSDKTADVEGYPLVMENCKINKRMKQLEVYGNCFQRSGSKNLLPYPYYRTTATINGVTFTDNGDGSITINGTATNNAVFYLYTNKTTLIPGTKKGDIITGSIFSDKEWDTSVEKLLVTLNYYNANTTMKDGVILNPSHKTRTFTITDDWYGMGFYILVSKGGVMDNITLQVQIELGATATEYEPYVLSPSPDCPSEIETVGDLITDNESEYYGKYKIPITVKGKNLFDISKIISNSNVTNNDDGTITAKVGGGTAATPNTLKDYCPMLKVGDTAILNYNISAEIEDVSYASKIYLYGANISWVNGKSKVITQAILDSKVAWYPARDSEGNNYPAILSNIQIEKGATVTDYEPYVEPITQNIYLDEPLRKVEDYADYIDFKNQKVIRSVKEKIFDGTEPLNGKYIDSSNAITYPLPHLANSVAILTRSEWKNGATKWANNTNLLFSILYYDVTTVDELKTKFAEWYINGEPLKIYYILGTSTEEDISCQLPKTLAKTTVIEVDTTLLPSNIKGKYIIK